jgi:hypothetical protein
LAKLDWRREDSAYAAATLFAAALVGFLVAGTFGLVASPFGSAEIEQVPRVQTLAIRTQPLDATPIPITIPGTTPSPTTLAAPVDSSAPSTEFTSAGGTSFSVAEGSSVSGIARDVDSGIHQVLVTFDPEQGETTTGPADLACDDAARTRCSWSADVPPLVGDYTVTAHAVDRAGNVGEGASQQIAVVNICGPVEDLLGGDGGLVGGLGASVNSLFD